MNTVKWWQFRGVDHGLKVSMAMNHYGTISEKDSGVSCALVDFGFWGIDYNSFWSSAHRLPYQTHKFLSHVVVHIALTTCPVRLT